MLGGIPPSIQHGRRLWARNLPLPLLMCEWGWGVLIYRDTEEHTRICLLENHSHWSERADAGWKVFKLKWDAGWKFGGCWMETVWGSKKTAKISKSGYFANIRYHNNSMSSNQVVSFIPCDTFQHTRFLCEFLQMSHLIPKYSFDMKKLKERWKDICALFTMDLRCSRRSDQKDDNIFLVNMT